MAPIALATLALLAVSTSTPGAEERSPTGAAASQESASAEEEEEGIADSESEGGQGSWIFFPANDLYRPYLADPGRSRMGVLWMRYSNVGVADSGSTRFGLQLGGRFGVVRKHVRGRPDRGVQIGIEAGFYGQFDIDRDYDNVGWDGKYGLILTSATRGDLAWKLGVLHTSSHIGDEYAERTGRQRIGYTREELVAAASWAATERWRIYIEGGHGYERRNEELQEPGRAQVGVEYVASQTFWKGRFGWYAAADLQAWQERDWQVDAALQVGLILSSDDRRWRLGVTHYDGRNPVGEFYQDEETYTALGLWLDL